MNPEQIYAQHIGENHEAACNAVYNAGYASGSADTEAAIESGYPSPQLVTEESAEAPKAKAKK